MHPQFQYTLQWVDRNYLDSSHVLIGLNKPGEDSESSPAPQFDQHF
jgi:hypothetical protein